MPPVALAQDLEPVPEVKPAQIVILVDESGSISPKDLVREKEAAGLIAQAEFSPRSRVAVVGFGSDEGGVGPVDAACPPIVVAGEAQRQQLSNCVNDLKKREKGRGDATDHAAALEQALSYFTASADGPKIVFLLTDGMLDVGGTDRYGKGKTVAQRTDAAQELLTSLLERATAEQVQVWPLGFGAVDNTALDRFAKSAFQGACGPNARRPEATVVTTSADVDRAIFEAFSAARCAGPSKIIPHIVGPGETIEVPVDIPSIATDGSIIVVKHDARIGIEFVDPNSRPVPKSGSQDGSTFQASGQNGAVEALRIVDPLPGTWTVRISSPPEVPLQEVSTAVTWQGAVQARLTPSSSSLSAGQLLTVSLSLRTRRGPVTDAAQLAALSFSAELARAGHPAIPISLADDGKASDPAGGDGTYTGQIAVPPDATNSVTIVGRVEGIGISGDEPRANVSITPAPPALFVAATLPTINNTVAPGESTVGKVTVANNSGQPRRVRVLVEQDADSKITVRESDAVQQIAASGNTGFPVTLDFAPDAPLGRTVGTLRIVDDADVNQEYGSFPFTVRVEWPPPYLLYAGIAAAVLAGVVVTWVVLRRRREQRLDGFVVSVTNKVGDQGGVASLTIPDGCRAYHFTIAHDGNSAGPPQMQENAEGGYRLTRNGNKLHLVTGSEKHGMGFDESVVLQNGLKVIVANQISPAENSGGSDEHTGEKIRVPRSTDPDL